MKGDGEYSVCLFFPDDFSEYVKRWVEAEEAVLTAKDYTERPAALAGLIRRIIVTDGGDNTCFAWEYGKGVTYPPWDVEHGRFVADVSGKQ